MKSFTHRMHQEDAPSGGAATTSEAHAAVLRDLSEVRGRDRQRARPFVTVAYAQSVDGSIAVARGQRSTLSGPESLRLTHALRANHDAILVGVGTVLADDPELRVRLVEGPSPRPVIVDSRLSTPPSARLLAQSGRAPFIGTTAFANPDHPELRQRMQQRQHMEDRGCRILSCPAEPNGWVWLGGLLARLRAEGITDVMVEGGARIITSFLNARLVDYVVVTIAPLFLGGLSVVGPLGGAHPLARGPRLIHWLSARLGDDLVLAGETGWASP